MLGARLSTTSVTSRIRAHCRVALAHPLGNSLGSSPPVSHSCRRKEEKGASPIDVRPSMDPGCIRSCVEVTGAPADETQTCSLCKQKKVSHTDARLSLHQFMCRGDCCGGRGDPGVHPLQRIPVGCKLAQRPGMYPGTALAHVPIQMARWPRRFRSLRVRHPQMRHRSLMAHRPQLATTDSMRPWTR